MEHQEGETGWDEDEDATMIRSDDLSCVRIPTIFSASFTFFPFYAVISSSATLVSKMGENNEKGCLKGKIRKALTHASARKQSRPQFVCRFTSLSRLFRYVFFFPPPLSE